MSFVKNVWADLVERKLWPVAVLLLAALVALPLLLGRAHGASVTPALPATPGAAAPSAHVVSLATSKPKGAPLGKAHDPFPARGTGAGANGAPQAPTVSPVGPASSGDGSGSAPTPPVSIPGIGSGSGAPRTTPQRPIASPPLPDRTVTSPGGTAPSSPGAAPDIKAGYRVNITYGRAGTTKPMQDIARLDPLSALNAPVVLYLGVKDDQHTALFMVLADVAVSGDGVCRPSPTDCQIIGLRAGEAEIIQVPTSAGSVYSYQLSVDKVLPKMVATAAAGVTARHRESKAGRALLRKTIASTKQPYVLNYRYSLGHGVLVKSATPTP